MSLKIKDKIFCCHHPALKERKETLVPIFNELEMDVAWVEGHPPGELKLIKGFKNVGEISLSLKHEEIFSYQIKNNLERVLILEDDAAINKDFPSLYSRCIKEFDNLNGDIMFIGECCGIKPHGINSDQYVYHHPSYMSRCTHCYVSRLSAAKIIHAECLKMNQPIDFKLNEIIRSKKLKSCYTFPSVHQNLKFKSTLGNS
jgi:GR25 family glycosyltransferase involved in LPS biosynthesis